MNIYEDLSARTTILVVVAIVQAHVCARAGGRPGVHACVRAHGYVGATGDRPYPDTRPRRFQIRVQRRGVPRHFSFLLKGNIFVIASQN